MSGHQIQFKVALEYIKNRIILMDNNYLETYLHTVEVAHQVYIYMNTLG